MAKAPRRQPSKRRQPAALEGNRPWRERGRVRPAASREKSGWDRMSDRTQHLVCLVVLLVVALWFTAPTTFGGRTLMGGDIVQWRGAAQAMIEYEASTGVDALWAPNVFAGMPGILILYPLKAIGIDTLPRIVREAGLWPLSHLLVMLGGAYALAFFLTRSKLAGVLCAVAYSLTTYIPLILTAGHNSKFVSLAYAPWLLLAFAGVMYRGDDAPKVRAALLSLLFGIAVAVNLRANHVQITYYVLFLAGVWWLTEGVAAVRAGRLARFGVSTALLAAGALVGLAMSAQPYLAMWAYKAQSIRGAVDGGGMAWDRAMAWSQGFGELLTLLVAGAYGGGGQTYWGPKPFTAGPHYLGAVVALLAVFGVLGVRRRAATGIAIGAVLMTAFSLGENLPLLNRPMFSFFPLFDSFRAPETWLVMVALSVAVLGAYGVYWVGRREVSADAETRKTRYIYLGLSVGGILLALVWLLGPSLASFSREGERVEIEQALAQQAGVSPDDPRLGAAVDDVEAQLRTERVAALRGDALRSLIFLGLAGALLVAYRRDVLPVWAMQAGLAVLVLVDLGGVARRYFNEDNPALRRTSDQVAAIPRYPFDGFIQERVAEAGGPGSFRVLPFVPALGLTPTSDGRSAFYYESIGGYHGAKLALFERFSDQVLYTGPTGVNDRALDLLSVRYVVAQGALPDMQAVFQDPETGALVLENADAMPRAWLVDSVRLVDDEARLAAALNSPSFDPARVALVSPPVGDEIDLDYYNGPPARPANPVDTAAAGAVLLPDTTTLVRRQRFTPREIVYEVRTDRPRVLVFSEVYYPDGWSATVDDAPAPILRADMLLRAVPVPSGRHLVRLQFAPSSHSTGVRVSAVSALLVYLSVIALAGLLWYRRGHPPK